MASHYTTVVGPWATHYQHALELLRSGEVVAVPTDTLYGVATAGLNAAAVVRLFAVKDRPARQAIPLLLADPADLLAVCASVGPLAQRFAARWWPGGVTLIVPAAAHLPAALLAGGATVAVRIPAHDDLRALIRDLGQPLAVTSANLHGGDNASTAGQVFEQLQGRIPLILDGGFSGSDLASTIVDVTGDKPRILRHGAVTIPLEE
ncbi:MAG: hypothetical protein NVSMB42_02060 [Herpetosiphon sp.]